MSVKTITCRISKTIPHPYIQYQNVKPEVEITIDLQPNDNPEQAYAWVRGFAEHCLKQAEDAARKQFEQERGAMPPPAHSGQAASHGGAYGHGQSTYAPNAYGGSSHQSGPVTSSAPQAQGGLPFSASRETAIEREAQKLASMERQDRSALPAQGYYPAQQGNGQGFSGSSQLAPAAATSTPAPAPQAHPAGTAPSIYDAYPEAQPNYDDVQGPPAPIGSYQLIP